MRGWKQHSPATALARTTRVAGTRWLALASTLTALLAASPADAAEEILVELRAGQLSRRTVLAQQQDETVLVPLVEVFDLVEIRFSRDQRGLVEATLWPERISLGVDPSGPLAWRGESPLPGDSSSMLWLPDGAYVSPSLLAQLLDVDVYVDTSELTVTLDPVDELPLGRRVHRERRRLIGDAGRVRVEPDLLFDEASDPWQGATLDWSLALPDPEHLEKTSYSTSFGGSLGGGALELRARGRTDGEGKEDYAASWLGAWPRRTWLRQARLGRAVSTGPRSRALDGFALSNAPYLRSSEFGTSVLRGRAEPGWEIELYRHGELLAYTRVDERGSYEFSVPVDYGQNTLEIRAYGPHGELRTVERAMRVDFDRLPTGRLEYGLSAGLCEGGDCEEAVNLDLRYGLDRHWTLRAGYDGLGDPAGQIFHHPYLGFSGNPLPSFRLHGEAIGQGSLRAGLGFEPDPNLRADVEHTRNDAAAGSPLISGEAREDISRAALFWRPDPRRRSFFVDADVNHRSHALFDRTQGRLGLTGNLARVRTRVQWSEEWDDHGGGALRSTVLGLQASSVLRTRRLSAIDGSYLRVTGDIDMRGRIRDRVSVSLGRRIGRTARLEIGASRSGWDDGPLLSISLSNTGATFFASSHLTRSSDGDHSSLTMAEGSLLWNDALGEVEAFPYRSLGRGGISGVLYIDENGNGRRDAEEAGVPHARLIAGHQMVETDGDGRYSVWNLVPFEATDISIDRPSLPDPLLLPAFELAAGAALPNGFRRIDLPLWRGVELAGQVQRDDGIGPTPLGGVPLRLRSRDGKRELSVRSFHDGEFYLLPVPPGEYELIVDEEFLRTRKLIQHGDSSVHIPHGRSERAIATPVVTLRSAARG